MPLFQNAGEASVANLDKLRHANGNTPTAALRLKMQKTMQNHAAVFRTSESLKEGCQKMDEHYKEMQEDIKVQQELKTSAGCQLVQAALYLGPQVDVFIRSICVASFSFWVRPLREECVSTNFRVVSFGSVAHWHRCFQLKL